MLVAPSAGTEVVDGMQPTMEQDSLYFSDVVELQRLALAHAEHNAELQETVERMKRAECWYLSRMVELEGQHAKEVQELREAAAGHARRSGELEAQVQALELRERDQQRLIAQLQQAAASCQEVPGHAGRAEGPEDQRVQVPDAAPEPRQCSTNFGATSLTMCGAHPAPKLRSDAKLVEVHGARCEANAVSSPCKWADASLVEVHGASPNQCLDAKLVEAQRGKADANAIQRASLDAKAVDVPRLQVPERWLDANAAQRQPPEARLVEVHGARCEAKTLAPPGQRLDAKLAENHGAWCDARTSASPGKALVSPPKPRLDVGSPGEVHGAGCEAHPVRSYWPDARLAEAHGQHEGDTRGAFNVSTPGFEFSSMQSPPRHHAVGTTCTSSHMMDLSVRSVALPPGAPLPPGASPAQALDSTVRTVPHAAPPQEVPIYVQPRAKPRVLPGAPPSHHAADPPRVALSAVGAGIRRTSPQPQPPGDPQRRLSAARISAAAVSLPTHAPHPAAKLYSPRSSLGRSGL
mmetsp:Transcript_126845/g.358899  ORF Transcript_126845/g.358899 Transcript_126845/m.358899 type:complete len:521 (+) Transcript_126845:54-1616(+)